MSLVSRFPLVSYWVASTYFFYNLFLSPSSLFDNTNSAIYQEGKKHTKQSCSLTYVDEGQSEGRIFWFLSSFKSTRVKLITLRGLHCTEFCRICFTISSWLLEGISNIKRRLFPETTSIHANNECITGLSFNPEVTYPCFLLPSMECCNIFPSVSCLGKRSEILVLIFDEFYCCHILQTIYDTVTIFVYTKMQAKKCKTEPWK